MNKLKTYIAAGFGCLQCTSFEEDRVAAEIVEAAKDIKGQPYSVWRWTILEGLVSQEGKAKDNTRDPMAMLALFTAHEMTDGEDGEKEAVGKHIPNHSIVMLYDFHLIMASSGKAPQFVRMMKEAIKSARATYRHLIIIGCQLNLPADLEKEITAIEYGLPTREELLPIAQQLAGQVDQVLNGETDPILEAGSGLTTVEFSDAAAKSIIEVGRIDATRVAALKAEAIRKGGILEVIEPGVTFENLGGVENLKAWVTARKGAFSKSAREYGLPLPRGILMCGTPGCGKSFATRAIAAELECPLIRLDAGKLFGGVVGQSESNVRSVIHQVEAFGKCVLMIDEIDKGFAGMVGGHDGDSGTTRRVIGTFLTWMQEKKSAVFLVATANDLTRLPPEMLRKGRWDELFFIDLPTTQERQEIWIVQIKRYGRCPSQFGIGRLAQITENWTGAEIESLFVESLYHAWSMSQEPTTDLIMALSENTVPLSKTMEESIKSLRSWAQGRARLASRPELKSVATLGRRIA